MCGHEGFNHAGRRRQRKRIDSLPVLSKAVQSERVCSRSIKKKNKEVVPSEGGGLT